MNDFKHSGMRLFLFMADLKGHIETLSKAFILSRSFLNYSQMFFSRQFLAATLYADERVGKLKTLLMK